MTVARSTAKSAFITGVSSGIGLATARVLLAAGWTVFGSVRNDADARDSAVQLGDNFTPIVMDVTDEKAVGSAAAFVAGRLNGEPLGALINNAGMALKSPLLLQPIDDFRRQVEVNLIGPVIVIKAFAELLGARPGARRSGRIVNISSIGGRIGPPFHAAYAASKHGVEGMSESLRRELSVYGIAVIIVRPGAVATPMWSKPDGVTPAQLTGTVWAEPYARFQKLADREKLTGAAPRTIGLTVLRALSDKKPRASYNSVKEPFRNWFLPTQLPLRWVDRAIAKGLGLTPNMAHQSDSPNWRADP